MSEPTSLPNIYEHLLSPEELLVMKGLACALLIKEVATINSIRWRTAYNYVYSAGKKMGIKEPHLQSIILTWVRGERSCSALDVKIMARQMLNTAMEAAERNMRNPPHVKF